MLALNKQIRDNIFYESKESLAFFTKWFNGSLCWDGSLVEPLDVEWLACSRTDSLDRVLLRPAIELFAEGVSKKRNLFGFCKNFRI